MGTTRMLEILNRICEGRGEEADVERLIELGEMIKDTSLCGLGQTAPNPVLSTIRHFGHEYVEHIRDKHCRAGVCPSLVGALLSACPANVDIPGFVSLVAETLRRGVARPPRTQSAGRHLLAGVLPHVRRQVPPHLAGRAGFHSRHQAIHGRSRGDGPTAGSARERAQRALARSRSSGPARRGCRAPTSWPGWATGRRSSRAATSRADCWSRRFPPTACRAKSSPAKSA